MKKNSITRASAKRNSTTSKRSWSGLELSQVKAEKARRCLKEFVMQAWPILEPETHFVDGLHINAICSHLQAVTEGRSSRPCKILAGRGLLARLGLDRPSPHALVVQLLPGAASHPGQCQVPPLDRVGLVPKELGRLLSAYWRSKPEEPFRKRPDRLSSDLHGFD